MLQPSKKNKLKIINPQYDEEDEEEEEDKLESIDDMDIPIPVKPDNHLVSTQMTNKSSTPASYQIKSKLNQVTRKLGREQIETADHPIKTSRDNENSLSTPDQSQRHLIGDPNRDAIDPQKAEILNSIQSAKSRQASLLIPDD